MATFGGFVYFFVQHKQITNGTVVLVASFHEAVWNGFVLHDVRGRWTTLKVSQRSIDKDRKSETLNTKTRSTMKHPRKETTVKMLYENKNKKNNRTKIKERKKEEIRMRRLK